ncbi:unnamed protein product [Nippostrongylus brasiliensis]|uniref:7TM_GPCR_Srx domain-containing protein n=1 Tax=Nippostrongylus brasiliensis TaxID=27835 RepID=A0A158R1J8_NIPBR|nr:unnamed protein product [Nippostrongylus brasiliensis]
MISIVWFLGFLHFIPYFDVDKCYVVFYASNYLWAFSANYCGFVLGKVLDFGTGVSVFINTGRSIRQRELKFFMQSCLQFSLFVVKLTNFYFISGFFVGDLTTYHWPAFFTTTLILIPFHYGDWKRRRCGNVATIAAKSSVNGISLVERLERLNDARLFYRNRDAGGTRTNVSNLPTELLQSQQLARSTTAICPSAA